MSRRALPFVMLACAVAGLIGYLAGRVSQPAAETGAIAAPVAAAPAPRSPVRPERPVIPAAPRPRPVTQAPEDAAAAPAGEQGPAADPRAAAAARAVVDAALARGAWTDDDAAALRPHLRTLSAEQRDALLATLFPAVNEGRVRLETSGPPI